MPPHKVGLLWGALADLRLGVPTFVETESLPCMPHVCKHDAKQGVGGALVTARSGEPGAWRAECCVPGDTSKQQVGRAHRGRGAPLQSCGGGGALCLGLLGDTLGPSPSSSLPVPSPGPHLEDLHWRGEESQ